MTMMLLSSLKLVSASFQGPAAATCWRQRINRRSFGALLGPSLSSFAARQHQQPTSSTATTGVRRFGYKPETDTAGEVVLHDDQTALKTINMDKVRDTIGRIRKAIGYETYDVTLLFVGDKKMMETNWQSRKQKKTTDILSFPFHEASRPGRLYPPQFEDIAEYYNLGDMVIDVPFVMRQCDEDRDYYENPDDYEVDTDGADDDDRGVSGAMARVYDPEKRIHMLLVQGMLHLVGYDHIEDEDYELMVAKEEELLKLLELV
jgi:probable rRNA maturation factor